MSINEIINKIKPYYALLLILAVISLLIGFWRLSVLEIEKQPIKIEYSGSNQIGNIFQGANVMSSVGQSDSVSSSGEVIGSKSGKKYYFPWCGTLNRVKPENRVRFSSIDEAKKAGYTPAGNCKGLK